MNVGAFWNTLLRVCTWWCFLYIGLSEALSHKKINIWDGKPFGGPPWGLIFKVEKSPEIARN
jgi:hypothetical protein